MKMFVLLSTVLFPAALSAQVLIPSHEGDLRAPSEARVPPRVRKERASVAPPQVPPPRAMDFKLRVNPPPRDRDARMRIIPPDSRYDYKLLMPRERRENGAAPRRVPQRSRQQDRSLSQ